MAEASQEVVDLDLAGFREVVRHPRAHAVVLGQYRIGEWAGVVALRRLLAEMQPEGKLHQAMTIHFRRRNASSNEKSDSEFPAVPAITSPPDFAAAVHGRSAPHIANLRSSDWFAARSRWRAKSRFPP